MTEAELPLGDPWLAFVSERLVDATWTLRRERDQERYQEAWKALRAALLEVEAHLAAAQLPVLHAQVQPHCLFNSLHGIGALVLAGEYDRAHAAPVALASLLTSRFDPKY